MKQRIAVPVLSFLLSVLVSIVLGGSAFAADAIPGEYLVKYKDSQALAQVSLRAIAGVRIVSHNPFGRLFKVKVAQQREAQSLSALLKDPNVEYVVPNIRIYMFTEPVSAEALKDQWAIKKVRGEEAWKRAGNKGSRSVTVAVIDTGTDYNHESLKINMVSGYDFKDNTSDPMDKTSPMGNPGHGTHCAGIVGASGLVDSGIVGISPEVSIMPLRFLDEKGQGDLDSAIKAVDYAIQKKVQIISASWGAKVSESQAMPLIEAVKRVDEAGIIFVVASGNDGVSNDRTDFYPANATFKNTINVAASGSADEKPSWSNFGAKRVHIAAPGKDIMSTLPSNKYGNLSGTSMAAPLVSGLVALLKAQDPGLTGAEARALLQHTGAKVSIESACNCRIDALDSVDALLAKKMFITPAAGTLAVGETMQFDATFGKPPFEYQVADASVGSVSGAGLFTAAKVGVTKVTVKDASGRASTSLDIRVADKSTPSQPSPPGGGGDCPLGDQQLCDVICGIQPELPFCKKKP